MSPPDLLGRGEAAHDIAGPIWHISGMIAPYLFVGAMLYLFPEAGFWLVLAVALLLYFKRP